MNRLAIIATLLAPCPAPDIASGFDMCPCGTGCAWPCATTRAAWIARGLDPDTEISNVIERAKAECAIRDADAPDNGSPFPFDWEPPHPSTWSDWD